MSLVFLLGCASILQMTLLPGVIVMLRMRIQGLNAIEQAAAIFACSLVTNDILTTLFTLAHVETGVAWAAVVALEGVIIAWHWRSWIGFWRVDLSAASRLKPLGAGAAIGGILLIAACLFLGHLFRLDWQTVFVGNDDVASWDRWAMDWASGRFPVLTSLYPQMIPANWSISYLLMGNTDIKMFAKAISPSYTLLTTLLFFGLAIRKRDFSYLFAGFCYVCLLLQYAGPKFLTFGYADQPLAFFSFLCFYLCVCCPEEIAITYGAAILASATGALLVKQGGVFVFVAALLFLAGKRARFYRDRWTAPCAAICVTLLLFCGAWYGCKLYQIHQGGDQSNLKSLTQTIHQGRTYPERVLHTWEMFDTMRGPGHIVTVALAALLVLGLLFHRTRGVMLLALLPFLTFYALFFSYEIRPSLMMFPVLAVVAGQTICELCVLATRALPRISWPNPFRLAASGIALVAFWLMLRYGNVSAPTPAWHVTVDPFLADTIDELAPRILVTAAAALAATWIPRTRRLPAPLGALALLAVAAFIVFGAATHTTATIVEQQLAQARTTIGNPAINHALYQLAGDGRVQAGIITDYWFMEEMPGLRQLFRRSLLCSSCTVEDLNRIAAEYGDARFLLLADTRLTPATESYLSRSARFPTLFHIAGERMLAIDKKAAD